MTAYPSLNRWLAAAFTLLLVGAPLTYWIYRGGSVPNPIESNPLGAQEKKDGGDWVMYGGTPSRNMVNLTAKGLPTEWDVDKKTNIKWVEALGSKAYGGPTVAGGRVFVGTNNMQPRDKKWDFIDKKTGKLVDLGIIMCFEEATGKYQWQSVFEKLPGGQVVDWPREGICSSPHIEGNRAYFVSNRCEVVCADAKTGESIWKLDMLKLGVFPHNLSDCSPLLVGDHLWVVTSNGVNEDHLNIPAPKAPSFIKVDKAKGKVLWQDNSPTAALLAPNKGNLEQKDFFKALVNRGELVQHGQWANAAYSKELEQVVFPGGDGWIYAFDMDGKLVWKFDCNPKAAKYALRTGERSDFIATPVVYKNRVYIGVGQDPEHGNGIGHLWCIDMTKKGDVSSELRQGDNITVKNPNSAMVWHRGGATNAADQKLLKRNTYFGRTMSTCAIHEDIVYACDLSGLIQALDADTGNVHWEYATKAETWSSPYYADGKVYLGNDEAVFVFEHGKKLKKLAENDMGGRVRATPVAANGVLYIMTENKLYAIKK